MPGPSSIPAFDPKTLQAHSRAMRALARSLVADEHLAEDAVQEAWVAALERPPRSMEALSAWLRRVTANFARRSAAREADRPGREERAARPDTTEGTEAQQEFELQHRVAAALRALPEPYQTAIHLRYSLDLSPRAIAAREGVPLDTVKTRLRRGLELLRRDLDGRYGDRRAWCLAAAPLLRPGGVAAAALPLPGLLSMKALLSVAASLTAVVAVVLAIRAMPATAEPPVGVAAAEPEAAELADPGLVPVRDVTPERAEVVSATAAGSVSPTAAEGVGLVRIEDAAGMPIAGARVGLRGEESLATDADGRAAVPFALKDEEQDERVLEIAAAGYMSLRRAVRVAPRPEVEFGTFVLVRGAGVRGVVLDNDQNPVEGALVIAADPGRRFLKDLRGVPTDVAGAAAARTPDQRARTDAFGRFAFEALAAGEVRLWAAAPGMEDGSSESITLETDRTVEDVRIHLETVSDARGIAGRVRMPEGGSAEGVQVWSLTRSREGDRVNVAGVAPDGSFHVQVESGAPHDLWAVAGPTLWDARREIFTGPAILPGWRGIVARGIEPGTTDLLLDFERAPEVGLVVTDTAGRPLESFTLVTLEHSGEDLARSVLWTRDLRSPARLVLPTSPVYLAIYAEGYGRVDLGPLTSDDAPDPIRVTLDGAPKVTGVVRADGVGIDGARLEAFPIKEPLHAVERAGFPLRMQTGATAVGTTGEDGAFTMTVRTSGTYFVRAARDGWASAEVGPLEIDVEQGLDGLELELTRGGSIEGRILPPSGASPGGWVVAASNGDPHLVTYTTGPDGGFRFDHMAPGPWRVDRMTAWSYTATRNSIREPVAWEGNCVVEEGRTTTFDLDLRSADRVVLEGRLDVDGRETSGWDVALQTRTEDDPFGGEAVDRGTVDVDGTFDVVAPEPGPYLLVLKSEQDEQATLLVRFLDLQGPVETWSERIEFGDLRGTVDLNGLPDPPMLAWIVEGPGGSTAARVVPGADGSLDASVPTGVGRLHAATPATLEDPPPAWPVRGTAEVLPGEAATLGEDG